MEVLRFVHQRKGAQNCRVANVPRIWKSISDNFLCKYPFSNATFFKFLSVTVRTLTRDGPGTEPEPNWKRGTGTTGTVPKGPGRNKNTYDVLIHYHRINSLSRQNRCNLNLLSLYFVLRFCLWLPSLQGVKARFSAHAFQETQGV